MKNQRPFKLYLIGDGIHYRASFKEAKSAWQAGHTLYCTDFYVVDHNGNRLIFDDLGGTIGMMFK